MLEKNRLRRKCACTGDPHLRHPFHHLQGDNSAAIKEWRKAILESKLSSLEVRDGSLWRFAKNLVINDPAAGAYHRGAAEGNSNCDAVLLADYFCAVFTPNSGPVLHPAPQKTEEKEQPSVPHLQPWDVAVTLKRLKLRKS